MALKHELRNARLAIKGFNVARGATYRKGDEADFADLLQALMVLTDAHPELYGTFESQLDRARENFVYENTKRWEP